MVRVTRWSLLMFLSAVPVVGWAAETSVVLDEACYLRRYYRFGDDLISPAAMKAEGPATLGDVAYNRLMKTSQKSLAVSGNDNFAVFRPSPLLLKLARKVGTVEALKRAGGLNADVDWREFVFRRMFYDPFTAAPAPADWAALSFDDAAWVLDRGPFQVDMPNDLPAQGDGRQHVHGPCRGPAVSRGRATGVLLPWDVRCGRPCQGR